MHTLAIDIGGTKVSLAVFEGDRMAARHTEPTDRAGGPAWMVRRIVETAKAWGSTYPFDRFGIGFGGPVRFDTQRVALSVHVGGWSDFPLVSALEKKLQLPGAGVMDNDANAAALGEYLYGAGKGCDPLLYLTVSTGIGGGIVLGGKVLRGADSVAGEIGHVTVAVGPEAPRCNCGATGCLERVCGGLYLERDHSKPARDLLMDDAFMAGYARNLAAGIKSGIMLLNPARVVLGGGISKAGDRLLEPVRAELRRLVPETFGSRIDVQQAALGDDSVLYGALALARQIKKD